MNSINLLITLLLIASANAFAPCTKYHRRPISLNARRVGGELATTNVPANALKGVLSAGLTLSVLMSTVAPAHASYSAFTAREADWNTRMAKKEITISSARSLKAQLNELVPENMNGQRQLFCPNGESSAVTPLQENRCGDRLATVSVFGRQQDVAGNSIPVGQGTTIASGLGQGDTAFPKYFSK